MPSPNSGTVLKQRIDDLLAINWEKDAFVGVAHVYFATVNIATQLFGASSPQVAAIVQGRTEIRSSNWDTLAKQNRQLEDCQGVLRSISADLSAGFGQQFRLESQGEVFADLVRLAKVSMDSGAKDAAAVLAAAALEDALKKLAVANDLPMDDEEMSQIISALKSAGIVSGTQGTLLKGFVQVRNKALHAQWSKIDEADVKSLIAFVEQFLLSRF